MFKRILLVVLAGVMLMAVLGACTVASPAAAGTERTIYMAAIEPKGGVTVDKEAFPSAPLPEGGGYILKEPNDDGRWEVSTYRWDPGTIVVNQGDVVTLEMVGINGASHPFTIEGYNVSDVVQRGHVTRVSFTADKAGIFKITCPAHAPAMEANLVVLGK
jgi:heme/copper-type cytochrome/quinol oxidase subunit 2